MTTWSCLIGPSNVIYWCLTFVRLEEKEYCHRPVSEYKRDDDLDNCNAAWNVYRIDWISMS